MTLTGLQSKFIDAYIKCLNATEAARMAGYSAKTETSLAVQGYKNLRNPKIQAEIQRRMKDGIMSATEVLHRLGQQASLDLSDFFDFAGSVPVFKPEQAKARGVFHLVKRVVYKPKYDSVEVTFHDPQRALDLLGKYHKLFNSVLDINISLELLHELDAALQAAGIEPDEYDRMFRLLVEAAYARAK